MKIEIEITEEDLKKLVVEHLTNVLNKKIETEDVSFQVKTKQNYKAEWELGRFKATIIKF